MRKYVRLLPDWTAPDKVVLSMPSSIDDNGYREDIIVDYAYYLHEQPDVNVVVMVNETTNPQTLVKLTELQIQTINNKSSDIWIRDWAPLLAEQDGELLGLKFKYQPKYAYNAKQDNIAGRNIHQRLGFHQREFDLKWEMGNFTTNGNGIVIATDQVLQDNKMYKDDDLKDYLINKVGCSNDIKVYVLCINNLYKDLWDLLLGKPDEAICHIDGLIRFISDYAIVYASNPVGNDNKKQYKDSFPMNWNPDKINRYTRVSNEINNRVNDLIQRMWNYNTSFVPHCISEPLIRYEDMTSGETLSDYGDYINYLRWYDSLHLPRYTNLGSTSKKYSNLSINMQLIDVYPDNRFVDRLCSLGGVLNCASWVLYEIDQNPVTK